MILNTYNNKRGFLDVRYLIPAAITGVMLVSGIILLGTKTNKYQDIHQIKKSK